jgi:hypothetical protein
MDNLWLLTEERPKPSVVKQILSIWHLLTLDMRLMISLQN